MKSIFVILLLGVFTVAVSASAAEKLPKQIYIPTDSKAQYTVLSVEKRANGFVYISAERRGSSGVSYSTHKVDCKSMKFTYVSDGEMLEDLKKEKDDGKLYALVDGSISDYLSRFACSYTK